MAEPQLTDAFTIERRGDVTIVTASPSLETMDFENQSQAARLVMGPVLAEAEPQIIFDLSGVNYFGSVFIGFLLRCWKSATAKGGSVALAGVSPHARELLHLTSLDMVWPIYANKREAIDALLSD
ncbi:STAS domain-containing protein [Isosphaeraceae bacterium EP7]